ncbi:MAG: hypothetical protein GX183_02235 [Firmicutes bacterium]|jgi:stage III sporulation protein AG|nr:hypothetical protein [Bacillota bacterium]
MTLTEVLALAEAEPKRRVPTTTQMLLLAGLGVLLMIMGTLLRAWTQPRQSQPVPADQVSALLGGGAVSHDSALPAASGSRQQVSELEAYRLDLCARVASILSAVSGAGSVRVEITLASGPVKVYASDAYIEEAKGPDTTESRRETELVLAPDVSGKGQVPIHLMDEMPAVAGVLVVASGASDSTVRRELAEAAATLLGVGAHRVKVVAGTTHGATQGR